MNAIFAMCGISRPNDQATLLAVYRFDAKSELCGGAMTASDALLTTLHPLFENVLQTVDHFKISCLHRSTFSKLNTEFDSDLAPSDFWAFPTMKRELRGKTFTSDQQSAARFREVGGAL
jgi:hypothetical protein